MEAWLPFVGLTFAIVLALLLWLMGSPGGGIELTWLTSRPPGNSRSQFLFWGLTFSVVVAVQLWVPVVVTGILNRRWPPLAPIYCAPIFLAACSIVVLGVLELVPLLTPPLGWPRGFGGTQR